MVLYIRNADLQYQKTTETVLDGMDHMHLLKNRQEEQYSYVGL